MFAAVRRLGRRCEVWRAEPPESTGLKSRSEFPEKFCGIHEFWQQSAFIAARSTFTNVAQGVPVPADICHSRMMSRGAIRDTQCRSRVRAAQRIAPPTFRLLRSIPRIHCSSSGSANCDRRVGDQPRHVERPRARALRSAPRTLHHWWCKQTCIIGGTDIPVCLMLQTILDAGGDGRSRGDLLRRSRPERIFRGHPGESQGLTQRRRGAKCRWVQVSATPAIPRKLGLHLSE